MARGWDKPYPVMVVSGSDAFMREREEWKARRAAVLSGRRVVESSVKDVSDLLAPSMFFEDRMLVIVRDVKDGKELGPLLQHHADHAKAADVDAAVLVVFEGQPVAELVAAVGKGRHLSWEAPKPWQEREVASKFLQAEVARLGGTISEDLALLMVKSSGGDRWLVSQEALKLVTYLKAVSSPDMVATREAAVAVTAPLASQVMDDLMTAVARGDAAGTSKFIGSLEDDAVIGVCSIVSGAASRWLYVAAALSRGDMSEDDMAARLSQHPYVFKQNILPHAKRWGVRGSARLVRDLARVERSVKSGRISPRLSLESVLLAHCLRGASSH